MSEDPIMDAVRDLKRAEDERHEHIREVKETSRARLAEVIPALGRQVEAALNSSAFDVPSHSVSESTSDPSYDGPGAFGILRYVAARTQSPMIEVMIEIEVEYVYQGVPRPYRRLEPCGTLTWRDADPGVEPRSFRFTVIAQPDDTLTLDPTELRLVVAGTLREMRLAMT